MDDMEKYHGKTIMILGAGQLQVPIIQKAKSKGLKVVVVTPGKDEPGVEFADAIVPLDVKDEEGILEAARKYEIDGITTDQTDLPVRTAAYVADNLGLPSIGYEIGCLFTDKFLMCEKCSELGIPVPAYKLVRTNDEAVDFYNEIGGKMILKPVDSQSSHGVNLVETAEDVALYFDEAKMYSRNGQVLLEEYIEGEEYSIDSYVVDGKCHTLAIGQYHPFSVDNTFSSYETVYPANIDSTTEEILKKANEKVVSGFGLKHGRTHGEFIISGGGIPYLIEIAARGGGSFFSSDDIRYVTGFGTEDFLIDFALGIKWSAAISEEERYQCCCTLFFYLPEGRVCDVSGIEKVKEMDFVKRNNLYQITEGMQTPKVSDKGARYFLVVVADSYEQLEKRNEEIRRVMKIKTISADGRIRLPIWK